MTFVDFAKNVVNDRMPDIPVKLVEGITEADVAKMIAFIRAVQKANGIF